ncbi:recombinase family protein [Achromobacter ruhlandii]|uniref:recombinase family protein n=2 Tax=Achromobacter ruhlandii TaxID=72557 RepID=UPI0008667CC5|nr:recombinase family protein [Achromobacter ruhlandii]AOU95819.1 recombinase [Achromobacter ruhlandii]MCZ8431713.1 recombinase family protein [Achromobacter ruhlandii]MDC6090350.1 recombinase family protein [Achromobacter ruhlandii]MDC6149425.1 recombinase family protein [Achromobacter ruhlandii]
MFEFFSTLGDVSSNSRNRYVLFRDCTLSRWSRQVSDHGEEVVAARQQGVEIPVAQYVRMSTDHQQYSTDNQAAAIAIYAAQHGMRIVKTYEDSGKSGLNLKGRSGLQALLRDVKQPSPGFEAVLVYDVSRWGRFPDPDEAATYAYTCKSHGVEVIYCAEPFRNDGSLPSTVLVNLKRSMSAEFSRELGVKVFSGACTLVRHGYRQGGPAGFGLRRQLIDEQHNVKGLLSRGEKKSIQTDRVVLVPGPSDEVAAVLRIYRMFLEGGMPERVIASVLNREGTMSDTGRPWTRGTIHQILTNEKYIGNNVYNRSSFKLKMEHVRNPPAQWVRCDGAFEGIVPAAIFTQVQAVIAARSRHLDDGQMLDILRQALTRYGTLSGILIDEDEEAPSSSAYRSRFGSLLRAYSLIGYTPRRDYAYLEINRALRRRHPELMGEISAGISRAGGWAVRSHETDLLTVNGEFTTSLVIARCKPTAAGMYRWMVRFDAGLYPDITVVARMAPSNIHARDFYILPAIDFSAENLPTLENNGFNLDAYRVDTLDSFYLLAGRTPLLEAA